MYLDTSKHIFKYLESNQKINLGLILHKMLKTEKYLLKVGVKF